MVATLQKMPSRTASWAQTAALVRRAQLGDREAFGELAEMFERTVYALCLARLGNPSDALELTQDVFMHALRRLGQLRDPERFAGWLRQMTVRLAINRATRRVPPDAVEDEVLEGLGAHHDNPLAALVKREDFEVLHEGLGRLKPLDRATLVDHYLKGKSIDQMATELEAPVGTIKRRLHTARLRLKAVLDPRFGRDSEDADEPDDDAVQEDELEAVFLA